MKRNNNASFKRWGLVGTTGLLLIAMIAVGSMWLFNKSSLSDIEVSPQERDTIISKGNDFSFKLFKKIAASEKNKNVFISTIGMLYSLNIINNAASGHTQQEIYNALDIDTISIDIINSHFHKQITSQATIKEDKFLGPSSYMLTAALFQAGSSLQINDSFQDILEHYYSAGIFKGDFDDAMQQKINKWCAKHTEGIISDFPIKEQDPKSANLLIANIFNGRWIQEFYKEGTKEEPFYGGTSPTVKMMNKTDHEEVYTYAKLDDFSLLKIPYVGNYKLYVILPEKADGLSSLLQSLDVTNLRSAIKQLKTYNEVYVKLPKFEVDYTFKAKDYLASLGISKIFSDNAELDKIQAEPMKIKDITQKTKVILDEDGTRAGAITSTSFVTLCSLSNPTRAYFYADHPFAYIIADPYGNYCFMGTFWGRTL